MNKSIVIGFLLGFIANLLGLLLWWLVFFDESFFLMLQQAYQKRVLGMVVSISAILDLVLFFILLRKNKYHYARGVFIWTICIAIFTLIIKIW